MLCLPAPTMLSVNIPFSGFYGSVWEDCYDREQEQLIEHMGEEPDRYDELFAGLPEKVAKQIVENDMGEMLFDASSFRSYMQETAKDYADAFCWWLGEELGLITYEDVEHGPIASGYTWKSRVPTLHLPFEYEELVSPRFYNFETDRVFVKLSLASLEYMKRVVDDMPRGRGVNTLEASFEAHFTSYDGFASSYDNAIPSKPLEEWDHNELRALVSAFVSRRLGKGCKSYGRLEDELYERLYEGCSNNASNAVDFEKLGKLVWERAAVIMEDMGEELEELVLPRCKHTLELPL